MIHLPLQRHRPADEQILVANQRAVEAWKKFQASQATFMITRRQIKELEAAQKPCARRAKWLRKARITHPPYMAGLKLSNIWYNICVVPTTKGEIMCHHAQGDEAKYRRADSGDCHA